MKRPRRLPRQVKHLRCSTCELVQRYQRCSRESQYRCSVACNMPGMSVYLCQHMARSVLRWKMNIVDVEGVETGEVSYDIHGGRARCCV